MKIKTGLIGFGLSGRYFHAPFLKHHEGYNVVAVSTSSKQEDVKAYLPNAKVYARAEDMIASPDIDLIINCGPNSVHSTLSQRAMRAGKHVVIEKPFANTTEEAREMIETARETERVLTVFQNRRWDGDFLTIKKLIAENRFGEIMHFESHFDRLSPTPNPARWREQLAPGSGTWWDLGAHLVDQMLQLFGEPDAVNADILAQRVGGETDDYFHVQFAYGKRRVVLQSSSFTRVTPRFQIFGTQGSFVKYKLDVQESQLRAGRQLVDLNFAKEPAQDHGVFSTATDSKTIATEDGDYQKFYELLHASITEKGPPPVTPESALQVMEWLELAKRSSAEKRTIVKLSP